MKNIKIACFMFVLAISLDTFPSASAKAILATAIQDGPRCKVVRIEPDSHTIILDHFDGGTMGTAVGNPTYSNSQPGLIKAAKFGLGDYVRYQIRPELEAQGTIEFWLKTSSHNVSLMNFYYDHYCIP